MIDSKKANIQQVLIVRSQLFRLKRELEEIGETLPDGTYLSTYTSNSKKGRYTYYCLAHKRGLLKSAVPENKDTYKLHLGRIDNCRYLDGLLELEKMQIAQTKRKALERIREIYQNLRRQILSDSQFSQMCDR